MFYMSSLSSYDGPIATLRLNRNPHRCGLGIYVDDEGTRWDVAGLLGGGRVLARKCSDALSYYSTAPGATSEGCHTWIPYDVELVTQKDGAK